MFGELTEDQKIAYDLMMSGQNVFLTGEGGTGKSYVVDTFVEDCYAKKIDVLVTAPTGISALNIGGSTIHRCFQADTKPIIEKKIKGVPDCVKSADVIIIDEISMCRVDLFDYVSRVIAKAEELRRKPIQLIVVGDFFQLPPVSTKKDVEILQEIYPDFKNGFAFESPNWKTFNFKTVYLKKVVRQTDETFIKYLNMARIGEKDCIPFFNEHCIGKPKKKGITLVPTNKEADTINERELKKIKHKSYEYSSECTGDVKNTDKVTADKITLKEGARVMLLVNDPDDRYQNGSFGEVVECLGNSISVLLDDNEEEVLIEPYTWNIYDYQIVEKIDDNGQKRKALESVVAGRFTQLPVKLAYAITMHKSQGQTYDLVNLIPRSFACGQLYVALSRVKTLKGLTLMRRMNSEDLITSDEVKTFYDVDVEMDDVMRRDFISKAGELLTLDDSVIRRCPFEIQQIVKELKLIRS